MSEEFRNAFCSLLSKQKLPLLFPKLFLSSNRRFKAGLTLLLLLGIAAPVLSQDSNLGRLTLARGSSVRVSGRTGGQTSLPAIVRDRDNTGNLCLGFATSTPDTILILETDFPTVALQVNSGGNDTTLVVQGPGGIRCGDDTGRNKDASIQGNNWRAGAYRVWVGTINSGARHNYTLTVQE